MQAPDQGPVRAPALDLRDLAWDPNAPEAAVEVEPAHVISRSTTLAAIHLQPGVTDEAGELKRRRSLTDDLPARERHLVRLRDGWVEPRMLGAFSSGGSYVYDSVRTRRQAEENGYTYLDPTTVEVLPVERTIELDAPAVLVGVPAPRNYFHWMLEAVPRLFLGQDYVPDDAKILVPQTSGFARESLSLAGAPDERIFEIPTDAAVRAPQLFVPPRGLTESVFISPVGVAALQALTTPDSNPLRVYVSRSAARGRRVTNEDELAPVLTKHGFQSVRTEELTLREQATLFATAQIVMSPHGAALANLAFARPGTLVIELQPEELDGARTQLYLNLATVAAQRYIQIVCGGVSGGVGDMQVEPEHLDEVLGALEI